MNVVLLLSRIVLIAVFAVAAGSKVADLDGTRRSVLAFGVPASLATLSTGVLLVAELATAAMLTASTSAWLGAVLALVLLGVFCVAAALNLSQGRTPDCRCFGQVHSEPVGPRLLLRNAVLAVPAIVVVAAGRDDAGPSMVSWIQEFTTAELVGAVMIAILTACVLALIVQVRTLARTQATLLEMIGRPESFIDIDSPLDLDPRAAADAGGGALEPDGPQQPTQPAEQTYEGGLPIGATAPPFELPSTSGMVSLAGLLDQGRPVVLFFVSASCGSCHQVLPKVREWRVKYGDALSFAVLASGERSNNRSLEAEADGATLLFGSGPTSNAFEAGWTPGAVVVGVDGRIQTETVFGLKPIVMLVMRTAAASRGAGQYAR